MLGCSCNNKKLEKLTLPQFRVLKTSREFEEPSRLRVIPFQLNSTQEVDV